jgi:hypothetical protein
MKNSKVSTPKMTYQESVPFILCETFEQVQAFAILYPYQPEPPSNIETVITRHIPYQLCQLPSSF